MTGGGVVVDEGLAAGVPQATRSGTAMAAAVHQLLGFTWRAYNPGTGHSSSAIVRRMPHPSTDPIPTPERQGSMATPELVSLIIAVIAWIALLGTLSPD